MAGDWTDEQNDAIVADYFAMLADDIARRPYGKAEHNRLLQAVIGRPRGSIEYKHQNISALLPPHSRHSHSIAEHLLLNEEPTFLCAEKIALKLPCV